MTTARRYDDPCGIARALDAVGDRWALLVVRELIFGPKRFVQLRQGLHGVSPNVLSQRLRDLETDVATLRSVAFGREPVAAAERDGRLTVEGDRHLAERFARMFPVPDGQPPE